MSELNVQLPSSWIDVELSELTSIHYGKALSATVRSESGRVQVIGSSGTVGYHDRALVEGPSLVVGRKGAAGSVHLVHESCWPIDTAYFIQPPVDIDLVYLSHVLGTRELRQLDKSTAIPSLSRDDLYRVRIPVAPRAEQTRIVAKLEKLLSDLDAGVAELKAAQKKLVQYRQSLLKAAVEGRLTAEWRAQQQRANDAQSHTPGTAHPSTPAETGAQLLARILTERRARWEEKQLARFAEKGQTPPKDWQMKYPEPVQPDTTDLPALPEGWVWSSIGQCFHVAVGATPSRKEPNYWGGAIPWVSSGEVRFSRIANTKEKITQDGLYNSGTHINPIGSVLLGMIGEGKTRGQVAILDVEAANNQNCAAIWVCETQVPSEFVYFWLWSQYEETRRGSSGNNQPALNKSIVERILFPLAPLNEMSEIARLVIQSLDTISEQESSLQISIKQSTAQRQNILRAAFAGQLVPQDPNDEPASVLLERVRAERAAQLPVKKTRGRKAKESA